MLSLYHKVVVVIYGVHEIDDDQKVLLLNERLVAIQQLTAMASSLCQMLEVNHQCASINLG
jgi:predicted transcriptional regulator